MTNSTPPEYNEIKHSVFALLHDTADLLSKCEDAVHAEFGLSQQQYLILMTIEILSNSSVKIVDVARRVNRNSNSISMIIDRMERNGLVERVRDLPDRRSVHLLLTDKGKEKLYQGSKVAWSLVLRLTSSFSEEEMETFAYLLGKLREKALIELSPEKTPEDMKKPDIKMAEQLLHGVEVDH